MALQGFEGEASLGCPDLQAGGAAIGADGELLVDLHQLAQGLHAAAQGDLLLMGEQGNATNGPQVLGESVAAAAVERLWRRHRRDV